MNNKNLYNGLLIVAIVINISFFKIIIDPKLFGWISNLSFIFALFLIPFLIGLGSKFSWLYIASILIGLLFHIFFADIKNPIFDAFRWIFLIILYIASLRYETWNVTRYVFYIFIAFHCILAISEYSLQTNIIDYSRVEEFSNFEDIRSFRAFGLMEHPLYSANVLIIFLAFVLVSNRPSNFLRLIILSFGTFALLTFNARAAIVVWFTLLTYRFLKTYRIIGSLTVLFVVAVILGELPVGLVVDLGFLGRLGEVGFSDGSSLNRAISYIVFFEENWSLTDIVAGGRVLFIPGSEFSLESGLLLTIAWWGWIIGLLKIILELVITYQALNFLKISDRYIVMTACWLTAFSNNNSINTFVLFFMLLCAIVFRQNIGFSNHSFLGYGKKYNAV